VAPRTTKRKRTSLIPTIAVVDLVKDGGGVMTLEDLAECDAEVIEPIKYDFKVGEAGDQGVSLWEVSGRNHRTSLGS
jgi:hypothetical protein